MELTKMKVETQNISNECYGTRTTIVLPKDNKLFVPGLLKNENELIIAKSEICIRIGCEFYSGELSKYEIDEITELASDSILLWKSERIPLFTIIKYRIKNKLRSLRIKK